MTDTPATEMMFKYGDQEPVVVKFDEAKKSHPFIVKLNKGPFRLEANATANGRKVGVNHVFVE